MQQKGKARGYKYWIDGIAVACPVQQEIAGIHPDPRSTCEQTSGHSCGISQTGLKKDSHGIITFNDPVETLLSKWLEMHFPPSLEWSPCVGYR